MVLKKKEIKSVEINKGAYFGFLVLGSFSGTSDVHAMATSVVQLSELHKIVHLRKQNQKQRQKIRKQGRGFNCRKKKTEEKAMKTKNEVISEMYLISAPPAHDRCGEVSRHVAHCCSHLFPDQTLGPTCQIFHLFYLN
jgi:hypothetical protein